MDEKLKMVIEAQLKEICKQMDFTIVSKVDNTKTTDINKKEEE